ncbi:MAG TPA: hypothetical protein VGO43_10845 [Pyrinomonadaceae bacterium]|jgi:hypothetical protein|nr:hypothetical protein [Pyrinomonadaceae bacterium]
MQRNNSGQKIWAAARNAATLLGLAMLTYNGLTGILGGSGTPTVHAQTDPFLSRRVDMLEQRLYSIESKINQVSIQSRPSIVPSLPSTTQNELDFLRTQVDSTRLRLGEAECGLLKLDERTLTAAQRRTNRTGSSSDQCRDNFATPIMLSARP